MTKISSKLTSRKNLLGLLFLTLAVFLPSSGKAANILFYYSSCDAFSSTLLKAVTVLQNAGNVVTKVDVGCTTGFCPAEIWTNYDQVWDCRYANVNGGCPGTAQTDNFTACWQTKGQDYIENHCGNMFILGENAGFGSRDDGDYTFLKTIGAVGPGLVNCPTGSANANDSNGGQVTLPSTLPGTTQYFGDFIGGIPTSLLNGTSFVNLAAGWNGTNVNRSVASGWSGAAQMTNLTGCNVGKLFMDWDMSKWLFGDYDGNAAAKAITDTFYASIASWLGVAACSCNTPTFTPTPGATNTFTPTATFTATSTFTPIATATFTSTATFTATASFTSTSTKTFTATATSTFTATATSTATFTATNTSTSTFTPTITATFTSTNTPTITFTSTSTPTWTATAPPDIFYVSKNLLNTSNGGSVSIYVSYPYFPGPFDLWVYNSAGEFIKDLNTTYTTIPIQQSFKWDGTNNAGAKVASGVYLFYLIEPSDRKLKRMLLIR